MAFAGDAKRPKSVITNEHVALQLSGQGYTMNKENLSPAGVRWTHSAHSTQLPGPCHLRFRAWPSQCLACPATGSSTWEPGPEPRARTPGEVLLRNNATPQLLTVQLFSQKQLSWRAKEGKEKVRGRV